MYIPIWLIVVGVIVAYFIYKGRKGNRTSESSEVPTILNSETTVEEVEERVQFQKERIFELEHFDSPQFIDVQDAFDAMEVNYLRLKQRFSHTPEKVLEIARDWYRYADALRGLKFARVMLDVDMSDEAFDNAHERSKKPAIIKDEIEKKFKSLLGDDWQNIPLDYHERMEKMEEPDEKTSKKLGLNDWKYYYRDSANLYKLEDKRRKEKEEREAEEKKGDKKSNSKDKHVDESKS
ncbi:MAG: hypothetical protein COV34_02995 [Candidatus Zambryskibacteria bacterium CG10_big_fil_rev_8_21_14_0_10_42_12]|uniref:Uncharacterized protein n=1 Tax=Candidatus Zambryskibacteria bacterium CG10_big_fil_rev_8_21_14_0_10_42_12 TaxID=1975115 RepID=A0A2H0QVW9_9BACT|nr:MAG: hypothetical protein COV34_02995 [Candidatus Zambryskibacteria bacterium CG10_big_fil_rev_8_21_14_0_10_42_12]